MLKNVIGLMSGTSMDGIDAAFLKTDGRNLVDPGESITLPYAEKLRQQLAEVVSTGLYDKTVEQQITAAHAEAITRLLEKTQRERNEIDLIGFHGHTIFHNPAQKKNFANWRW